MKLILIEAPAKQSSVQKYAGSEYKVLPTFGHIRDLPVRGLAVDVENNFKPDYQIMEDKKKVVNNLLKEAKKAESILIATDPDREGEAIAWHAANILGIDKDETCRVTFNEISDKAVKAALEKPRAIDINLVDAQQARRVLDRLVGYKLSPLLNRKIQGVSTSLSAGRVQSVTLRLIVDRDREIENFKPEEYWTLEVKLKKDGSNEIVKATLSSGKDKKVKSKEEMDAILDAIENADFIATNVKKSVTASHPSAPFTTPTMQQEAGNKLGFNLKLTTQVAQNLYEGVDIVGEGKTPLVTYIRSDSVRVSPEAQKMALDFITEKYGEKYVPEKPRVYKNKKGVQDGHEAIRPISLARTPESLKNKIDKNAYKLYKLIYDRFVASQMSDATYNSLSVDIEAAGHKFKTTGRTPIFDGYTAVYTTTVESDENDDTAATLPQIETGDKLVKQETKPEQKFTKPPARYTEATIVKAMEEKGIGRPATYSQTVTTILNRKYVEKDGKALISTELGRKVCDMLILFFSDIMDVSFTADMEEKLDDIELGGKIWQKVVGEFYQDFDKELKAAFMSDYKDKTPLEETDIKCEKCGANMVIREGKFGKFLACPNYPKCKNTRPLDGEKTDSEVVGKCPNCGKDLLKLKSKRGKVFYGCSGYPDCDYKSWDIPANEKCPKCGEELIVRPFKNTKIILCRKCDYNRKEEIKKENKTEEE